MAAILSWARGVKPTMESTHMQPSEETGTINHNSCQNNLLPTMTSDE